MLAHMKATASSHKIDLGIMILLAAVSLMVYWPALGHDFLSNWDDPYYVVNNDTTHGLSWAHLGAAFSRSYAGGYTPLPLVSYMLDFELWGLDATGYVLTNVVLHAANGLLLFLLLRRLFGRKPWTVATALLFLLHPVQVESVAWISERKNVLAMFFLLITLTAYLWHRPPHAARSLRLCAITLASFLMALLSKSVAVVLPLFLVAIELCVLSGLPVVRRLRATLPLFALAGTFAAITVLTQSKAGIAEGYHGGSPFATVLTMLPILIMYVRMVLWPAGLSAWYDPPVRTEIDGVAVVSAGLILLLVLVGTWLFVRKRTLCCGYLIFFIGLLPVLQIIPLVTLIHDRYLYVPMLGAAVFLCRGLLERVAWDAPLSARQGSAALVVMGSIAMCVVVTRGRLDVWKNAETLWTDALRKSPGAPLPYGALADVALDNCNPDSAGAFLQTAIALAAERAKKPGGDLVYTRLVAGFHVKLARVYEHKGRIDEAEAELRSVLVDHPENAVAHHNLGVLLWRKGDIAGGTNYLEAAVSLDPGNGVFLSDLDIARE